MNEEALCVLLWDQDVLYGGLVNGPFRSDTSALASLDHRKDFSYYTQAGSREEINCLSRS